MRKSKKGRLLALHLGGQRYPLDEKGRHVMPLVGSHRGMKPSLTASTKPPQLPLHRIQSAPLTESNQNDRADAQYSDLDHEYELPPIDFDFGAGTCQFQHDVFDLYEFDNEYPMSDQQGISLSIASIDPV
jgi:hypothetical protein